MAETAPPAPLSQEEGIALPLALLGHLLLVAVLVFLKPAEAPLPPPGRMTVTISNDVGLTSSSPDPKANPAPDSGPELGDMPPPPEPEAAAPAKPEPRAVVTPPKPAPAARAQVPPKPQTKPATPQAKPATRPQAQNQRNTVRPRPGTRPGASRFDDAFGQGIPGAKPNGKGTAAPAAATGQQKERWKSFVMGRVLPRFGACVVSGLDVDKLYADIVFTLSIDGKVLSIDQVSIGGITASNRAQAEPMKVCARKAALQGAPYLGLPPEYYNDWKTRRMRLRVKD